MHERFKPRDLDSALMHILEEMGEATQAFGKCFRFGPDSVNPLLPEEQQESNIAALEREIEDVRQAIEHWYALRRKAYAQAVTAARRPPDGEEHVGRAPAPDYKQPTFDPRGQRR